MAYTNLTQTAPFQPSNNLSDIRVVPNPFRQVSGHASRDEDKRLAFVNIPRKCTIRIFTLSGDHIKTLKHDGFGETAWGSNSPTRDNYMLTEFRRNIAPGLYIFHVENETPGEHEGETYVGKFVVIK